MSKRGGRSVWLETCGQKARAIGLSKKQVPIFVVVQTEKSCFGLAGQEQSGKAADEAGFKPLEAPSGTGIEYC